MSRDIYSRVQPKRFQTHFHPSRKQVRNARGLKIYAGGPDTVSKNNLTEISWAIKADLGLTLLPFKLSCDIKDISIGVVLGYIHLQDSCARNFLKPLASSCFFHTTVDKFYSSHLQIKAWW